MAKTIADAHLSLAYRLGSSSSPGSATELAKRLNWFKKAIDLICSTDMPLWFLQEKTTDATEADVEDYAFPSDARLIYKIKVDGYEHKKIPFDEVYNRFEIPTAPVAILSSFQEKAYYTRGTTIFLIPTPSAAPDNDAVTSITSTGTTATVTTTAAHGYTNDDYVTIAGANQTEYNVRAQITVTSTTTFTYTISGAPASPATGTITSTKDNIEIWYWKIPTAPTSSSSGIVLPDQYEDALVSYAEGRYWSAAHKRAKAADAFAEFEEWRTRIKNENNRHRMYEQNQQK